MIASKYTSSTVQSSPIQCQVCWKLGILHSSVIWANLSYQGRSPPLNLTAISFLKISIGGCLGARQRRTTTISATSGEKSAKDKAGPRQLTSHPSKDGSLCER